jgi:hypothetical protein
MLDGLTQKTRPYRASLNTAKDNDSAPALAPGLDSTKFPHTVSHDNLPSKRIGIQLARVKPIAAVLSIRASRETGPKVATVT